MTAPPPKHGLTLGPTRELLLPATLLGCFAIYYLAEQPFWVVLACAMPMLAVYALAPAWATRSVMHFDRDAVSLLAAGRDDELRGRYARALGMRLFATPAVRAERRAMVLAESGDMRGARRAYAEALEEHADRAPLRVMLGYAHACFALGDDGPAIRMYRKLLATAGILPGVERNLAHALVRRGEELEDALAMLSRAEREPADAVRQTELKLLRALAHAKLGDHAQARALFEDAGEVNERHGQLREQLVDLLQR